MNEVSSLMKETSKIFLVPPAIWEHNKKTDDRFATIWMDLEGVLSLVKQIRQKDKYGMLSLASGILKIKQMNACNKRNRNRQMDTEDKLVNYQGDG